MSWANALVANSDAAMDANTKPVFFISCSSVATIARLKREGFTIVLVEQNFHFAASVADRHYIVEQGRVIDMIRNAELEANIDKLHAYLGV